MVFALSIAQSTGLRNRLVHQYEAIDHTIVHSAIAEAITQYTEYCRHIMTFLSVCSAAHSVMRLTGCCTGSPHQISLIQRRPRAYGQSRGVMPFSCAYLAADASTRGRTNA